MTALLLACALLVQSQDERVRELVAKLENGGIEERGEAELELVRVGEAALRALRAAMLSGGPELRARAGAIVQQIELEAAIRAMHGEARTVTLRAEGARLDRVLEDVARQAGVTLELGEVDGSAVVSVIARDMSLLEALDRICRTHGKLDYERKSATRFAMAPRERDRWPSAYFGPWCMRVTLVDPIANRDGSAGVCVELVGENDRAVLPPRALTLKSMRAVDDTGASLRLMSGIEPQRAGERPPGAQHLFFAGLSDKAKSLAVRGEALFAVPIVDVEAVFDPPERGIVKRTGPCTVELTELTALRVFMRVRRAGESADAFPATANVVVVDDEGYEHVDSVRVVERSADNVGVRPPTLRAGRAIRAVRIGVATKTVVKRVPFELRDVKLP